jgi:hypothetical protein
MGLALFAATMGAEHGHSMSVGVSGPLVTGRSAAVISTPVDQLAAPAQVSAVGPAGSVRAAAVDLAASVGHRDRSQRWDVAAWLRPTARIGQPQLAQAPPGAADASLYGSAARADGPRAPPAQNV